MRVPFNGDHPRVCGEHAKVGDTDVTSMGSSPRVRGTLQWRAPAWRECGIIPACAGNTLLAISSMQSFRDHPRVCGEHLGLRVAAWLFAGSSPRVRGTRRQQIRQRRTSGIIPACAGNTPRAMPPSPRAWDHPRVCGEHMNLDKNLTATQWIIPACAGNTWRTKS